MQNKKILVVLSILFIGCLCITGCGKKAKLEDNHTVVKMDNGSIKADDLYNALKDKYGISVLVDLMDHKLLDEKYKDNDEEKETIDSQISQMKAQYNDDTTFLAAINQYLGVKNEDELRDLLSLEYKRNLAVEDYIKDNITDDEVQKYYDEEVIGDMKVRHILIKPETTSDMTTEEKEKAEKEAKKKAKDLIKQLDEGANFEELAKEYSDDTGSASDGGLIDYFNKDSNMDEAFFEASVNLKENEYTKEPVKSVYGYHIILKIDDKEKPKLEDEKESILETLMQEKLDNDSTLWYESLKGMREKAGIDFKDDTLKKEYDELMEKLIENARK